MIYYSTQLFSYFNSRAAKIEEVRERLGIIKPLIQPKNKEKVIKEALKKKPDYLVEYENRFKTRLKENFKECTKERSVISKEKNVF